MQWLNEPASWQRTSGVLTVSVDPGTDFWRQTSYGYIRDSGHVYGEVLAGDLDVSVRIRCTLDTQYDQAGIMLRADEQTWLKTGVEFFEGQPRLSTVLTLGRSSWTVTSLPEDADEIVLRVARRDDAVEVRYGTGAEEPTQLAALVYLPPEAEVLAGVMCAAPEGPGFIASFHDLHIAGQRWDGEPAAPAAIQADGERETWAERDQDRWAAGPDGGAGRRWLEPDEADVSSAEWTPQDAGGKEASRAWAGPGRDAAWPAADAGQAWAADGDGDGGLDARDRAGWPEPAAGTASPPWADAAEPGAGPYWPETGTGGGQWPAQQGLGTGTAWPAAAAGSGAAGSGAAGSGAAGSGAAGTGAAETGAAGTGAGETRPGRAGSGEWPASPAAGTGAGDWPRDHAASTGNWPAGRAGSGEWPAQPAGAGSGEWPAQPAGAGSGEWPIPAGDGGPGRDGPADDTGPAGAPGDEPGPERGSRDRARKSRPGRVRIGRDRPGKDRPGRDQPGRVQTGAASASGTDDSGQPGASAATAGTGPDTAAGKDAGQPAADSGDPWRTADGARADADPDLDWFRQVRSDSADGEAEGAFGLAEGSRTSWPGSPAAADPPVPVGGTDWPVPADGQADGEAGAGAGAGPGAGQWRRPDSGSGGDWMQLATSAQARHWIAALASDLSSDWPGPPVLPDSIGDGDAAASDAGLTGAEPGETVTGADWTGAGERADRAAPQDYPADAADDTDPASDASQPDSSPWAWPGDPGQEAAVAADSVPAPVTAAHGVVRTGAADGGSTSASEAAAHGVARTGAAHAGSVPASEAAAGTEPSSGAGADTGASSGPDAGPSPVSGPEEAGAAPVPGPGAAAGADSAETSADADPGEIGAVPGPAGDPGTSPTAPAHGTDGHDGLPDATDPGEHLAPEQRNGLPHANGAHKPAAEPGDASGAVTWRAGLFGPGAAGPSPAGPAADGEGLADDATDPHLPVTPGPAPAQPPASQPPTSRQPAASADPALAGKTAGRPVPPAGPMDAADEWISLLTTDPADD